MLRSTFAWVTLILRAIEEESDTKACPRPEPIRGCSSCGGESYQSPSYWRLVPTTRDLVIGVTCLLAGMNFPESMVVKVGGPVEDVCLAPSPSQQYGRLLAEECSAPISCHQLFRFCIPGSSICIKNGQIMEATMSEMQNDIVDVYFDSYDTM